SGGGYWGAGLNGVISSSGGTALYAGDTGLLFVEGGWDFSPSVEGYADLGIIQSRSRTDGVTESTGVKPFLAAGMRGQLLRRDPLSVMLCLNGTAYADFTRSAATTVRRVTYTTTEVQRHPWDLTLLLALQRQSGNWSFYGGPLAYSFNADVE